MNLDMINYLLDDINKEFIKKEKYEKGMEEGERLYQEAVSNGTAKSWQSRYSYIPKSLDVSYSKQRIKDDIKMIRRLCMDLSKEVDNMR